MTDNPNPNPTEALAAIQAARDGVVGRLTYPPIYDLAYGASCALLVFAQSLPRPWSIAMLGIAVAGLLWMMRTWTNRFGVWISGFSPPRARWVAFGLAAVLLGLIVASSRGQAAGLAWAPYAAATAAFVLSIAASRLWGRVWQAEMEARP